MGLKTAIKEICQQKKLVNLYFDEDMEESIVGIVEYVGKEKVILKMIEDNGTCEGYYLRDIEGLSSISVNSSYIHKMDRLANIKNESIEPLVIEGRDLEQEFLDFTLKMDCNIGIYCGEYRYCGRLIDFSKEYLQISVIGTFGDYDGELFIRRENVLSMEIYSKDLIERELLVKSREQAAWGRKKSTEFENIIEENIYTQNLLEIYTIKNQDDCYVGAAMKISQEQILFQCVDTKGCFDGYRIIKVEEIAYIITASLYLKKIKKCVKQYAPQVDTYISRKEDLQEEMLEYVKEKNEFIQITAGQMEFVGKLVDYNQHSIRLMMVDEYGDADGERYFCRAIIEQMGISTGRIKEAGYLGR